MSDPVDAWASDLLVRGRAEGTITSYRSAIRGFRRHVDAPWECVTADDLKAYLAILRQAKAAMSTIKGNFAALASLFDYLQHMGIRSDNPVTPFRARYLDRVASRKVSAAEHRRLISVDEAQVLMRATMDVRARSVLAVLLKTGIRREEASNIDVEDIDWKRGSITLKPHAKRTNPAVYFDEETARMLKRWLVLRTARGGSPRGPLFINQRDGRLGSNGIYELVTSAAQRVGLHNPAGPMRERFTPHCCRHWFTTHLRRAGMPDHMIAELRGDADARTMDIYTHLDHDEVREMYLTKVPQLNI